MMGGCYVCRYCCVKFPNQTPRAIVRHTELYHKSEVTKFLDDPVNHPLQCGSCMWKCRQDLLTFKKHIKFHTSESSQGIRCQPQELNGQFSNTRPNVDLQAHEYDVDETDNSNHPKSDSIDSNSSLRDAMGIQESDHSDETPVLEGRFENESYTQGDAAERFLLELYTKGNATTKNIQHTVESVSALIMTTVNKLESLLSKFVDTLPLDAVKDNGALTNLISEMKQAQGMFTNLSTEYQRMKHFSTKGLVQPESFKIGERDDVRPDGSNVRVEVQAQYIPIIPMLSKYYDYYSKLDCTPRTDDVVASYFDTQHFKSSDYHSENPSCLKLVLYHDDIEVANPLGSRAGVHKLTMFYYSVHGQMTSSLQSIHLAIVCHASDVKEHGYDSILRPFICDLNKLFTGVEIQLKNASNSESVMKASLEHVVGDNLAANAILGMVQSFRGGYFCRFCYIPGNEVSSSSHCRDQLRRSDVSHFLDVERVMDSATDKVAICGVKEPCALDQLPYFSGVKATVPDIMHDILEGIGKLEIRCLLAALTRDKIVTLDYLNQKITSMDYGRHEASNRPSVQRNIDAMRQSASQMWALIRFLPQMIGHLVPIDYPEWAVFLLLRTIMDMVFSPQITYDCTRTLDGLVEEHHSMFIEVFGEDANLTAKAHFMTHYGRCIREHGPLTNFWCMRYESKHRLAKLVASVSCNFKNLPLTVAKRYQIKEYADGQEQQADDVTTKNGVEISGTDYRVGDIIVVSYSHYLGQPMFGKIKSIYTKGGGYHFAYVLVDTIFYSHYHAYQVMYEADELNQISQKLLPYTLPASLIHTDNGLIFLCLRHMVI